MVRCQVLTFEYVCTWTLMEHGVRVHLVAPDVMVHRLFYELVSKASSRRFNWSLLKDHAITRTYLVSTWLHNYIIRQLINYIKRLSPNYTVHSFSMYFWWIQCLHLYNRYARILLVNVIWNFSWNNEHDLVYYIVVLITSACCSTVCSFFSTCV